VLLDEYPDIRVLLQMSGVATPDKRQKSLTSPASPAASSLVGPGMSDPHDDSMGRADGHRYDAPESEEDRAGKSWTYAALGILVVVLLVLMATGTVQIFPH
jgi:hypothetical protein